VPFRSGRGFLVVIKESQLGVARQIACANLGGILPAPQIFVDYDNVDQGFRRGGLVDCAKLIVQAIPESMLSSRMLK